MNRLFNPFLKKRIVKWIEIVYVCVCVVCVCGVCALVRMWLAPTPPGLPHSLPSPLGASQWRQQQEQPEPWGWGV